MKNILRILVMTNCIFIATKPLLAQWVPTNSLCGGYFASFAVSGTKIFAGAYGDGIFLSTNNGASWTKLSLADGTWINALAVSPNGAGGTNLFVGATYASFGTANGVVLSTDNGQSWNEVNSGLPNSDVTALAVSANGTGGTNLFAATNGGGLFRSTNNGTNWTEADAGLGHPRIAALTVSGTNVFAGADYGGVFLSTNDGTSWTWVSSGMTNIYVTALAVSADGTKLFAGTDGGGVFLSTNNGTNWTEASNGLTNTHVRTLAVSGANVFAGTDGGGVFLSTDNGASWNPINTGLTFPYVHALGLVPDEGGGTNIFAGTWGDGIFLSTNNGVNWTYVNSGLICRCVNTLAVCDSNLFVGTNGCGAFISTNNGTSWTQVNGNLTGVNVYALAVVPNDQGGKNLVAGSGGIFLSSDNGASWILTTPNYVPGDVHSLAVSGTGTGNTRIFAGGSVMDIYHIQVYVSIDEGFTWTPFGVNINASFPNALAVSDTNLFVGTENRGVFLTTDGGMHWAQRNNGLMDSSVNALTISPNEVGGVNIFAATNHGIFISTDNGSSWKLVTNDPVSTQAQALAICRKNMLAGVSNNVWKRPLSEMITGVKNNNTQIPIHFVLEQNYPNPFNPSTNIAFSLPSRSFVSLKVYDLLGRKVATIVSEEMLAGNYSKQWNAGNIASGIYFYRLQTGSFIETKKLVLLR